MTCNFITTVVCYAVVAVVVPRFCVAVTFYVDFSISVISPSCSAAFVINPQ